MSPCTIVRSALAAVALTASATTAFADDALGHVSTLAVGPLIGGQDVRFDLRTQTPNSFALIFFGADGMPTILGPGTTIGLDVGTASLVFLPLDNAGRFTATLPTLPGEFGPAATGATLFFQSLHVGLDGKRRVSNVDASEIEPLPAAPGFLVEDAASRLPVGFDTLGGAVSDHADINRDGYLDLVIATEFDVRIWINDATNPGTFLDETAARISLPGDAVGSVKTGDIDCDGDVDILVSGGFDDFNSIDDRLYINDGTGVFTQGANFPVGVGLTQSFEFADVDQDGDLDIWLAVGAEGHLAIPGLDALYINIDCGQGFVSDMFIMNGAWNDDQTTTGAINAFDMDSDGDLDAMVFKGDSLGVDGTPGQPNVLLENDGFGVFTDVSATNLRKAGGVAGALSDNSGEGAFIDLDGDLDLDIVVANSVLNVLPPDSGDVYINQGGLQGGTEGVFHDDPFSFLEFATPADGIRTNVHLGDIDADGDMDVIMSIHELFLGADQAIFLNDGGANGGVEGNFTRQTWFDPPFSGEFGTIGDFVSTGGSLFDADNDGDLDYLMLANGFIVSATGNSLGARFLVNTKL